MKHNLCYIQENYLVFHLHAIMTLVNLKHEWQLNSKVLLNEKVIK